MFEIEIVAGQFPADYSNLINAFSNGKVLEELIIAMNVQFDHLIVVKQDLLCCRLG